MDNEKLINLNDVTNHSFGFETLKNFKEFFEKERGYWKEKSKLIEHQQNKHPYISSSQKLEHLVNLIEEFERKHGSVEETQKKAEILGLVNKVRELLNKWLWSGHVHTETFVSCHLKFGLNGANAFLAAISNQNNSLNVSDTNSFSGALMGYEFKRPDLNLRLNAEKNSFEELRRSLNDSKIQLIDEVNKFKVDFKNWDDDTRKNLKERSIQDTKEHTLAKQEFNETFEKFMSSSRGEIQNIEKTYKELLKLKAPADYWRKASYMHLVQGLICLSLLLTVLGFSAIKTLDFLNLWLEKKTLPLEISTIQGVFIFGSALALCGFAIRVLSRLTFSSFHLMADARERYTLTYLYLSLIKENAVNENSVNIVFQSLFSRSETGLLGGDSSPTLPTAVSEIINKPGTDK